MSEKVDFEMGQNFVVWIPGFPLQFYNILKCDKFTFLEKLVHRNSVRSHFHISQTPNALHKLLKLYIDTS